LSAFNVRQEAVEPSRRALDKIGEDVGKIKKLLGAVLAALSPKTA
jgi:hypothetical protein